MQLKDPPLVPALAGLGHAAAARLRDNAHAHSVTLLADCDRLVLHGG
jgi:hypothetical protein